MFQFFEKLYMKPEERTEEYWNMLIDVEDDLYNLGQTWWNPKKGPVFQECYLQLLAWNHQDCLMFKKSRLMCAVMRGLVLKLAQQNFTGLFNLIGALICVFLFRFSYCMQLILSFLLCFVRGCAFIIKELFKEDFMSLTSF